MADWPDLEELKQVLDVTSIDFDDTLSSVLQSAIDTVKGDVGDWDEVTDVVDDKLHMAALRLAELLALKPELAASVGEDPTYQRHIKGKRRQFGLA